MDSRWLEDYVPLTKDIIFALNEEKITKIFKEKFFPFQARLNEEIEKNYGVYLKTQNKFRLLYPENPVPGKISVELYEISRLFVSQYNYIEKLRIHLNKLVMEGILYETKLLLLAPRTPEILEDIKINRFYVQEVQKIGKPFILPLTLNQLDSMNRNQLRERKRFLNPRIKVRQKSFDTLNDSLKSSENLEAKTELARRMKKHIVSEAKKILDQFLEVDLELYAETVVITFLLQQFNSEEESAKKLLDEADRAAKELLDEEEKGIKKKKKSFNKK